MLEHHARHGFSGIGAALLTSVAADLGLKRPTGSAFEKKATVIKAILPELSDEEIFNVLRQVQINFIYF